MVTVFEMNYEKDLYPPIVKFLNEKGYECHYEVKLLTRSIDLIALKRRKIIAIELKVRNWQKALQQAITCRLCAQETYLAIAAKYSHRVDKELLHEYGIGLITSNGKDMEILLKAEKSPIIHKSVRNNILQQINGRE